MTKFLNISTDNTLGGSSASDVLVASQKAVKDYVDQHGGGGSVAIDDTTITQNGDNEIQAVATINANTATGSTNPIYDWVGTLEEYETQAVATNHPDWVCYIVDDLQPAPDPIRREVAERNMGEVVYSLIPVADAGLHLLDGGLLPGDGMYADFYNYMVDIYSSAPQIFCSEADWQASVSSYGACGKFVLNTTNQTIRLPKVTGFVEGTIVASELGSLVEAGLPNITGAFTPTGLAAASNPTGCFSRDSSVEIDYNCGTRYGYGVRIGFDASDSDSIYGNSTTVQPQAIKGYVYMVVANTVKTEITVDIDEVTTDLNQIRQEVQELSVNEHRVIAFQEPTSANNYTWYRKYADGWVEQGGYVSANSIREISTAVTLPVAMANMLYSVTLGPQSVYRTDNSTWNICIGYYAYSTTRIVVNSYGLGSGDLQLGLCWQVRGMAA